MVNDLEASIGMAIIQKRCLISKSSDASFQKSQYLMSSDVLEMLLRDVVVWQ